MLWFRRPDALIPTLSLLGYLLPGYPLAAIGYVIAYLLFLCMMAFLDAFQHSYDMHYRLLRQQPSRFFRYRIQRAREEPQAGADGASFLVGV